MTRKDYRLIAATIAAFCDARPDIPRDELALAFALALEPTNVAFNMTVFLLACGVQR